MIEKQVEKKLSEAKKDIKKFAEGVEKSQIEKGEKIMIEKEKETVEIKDVNDNRNWARIVLDEILEDVYTRKINLEATIYLFEELTPETIAENLSYAEANNFYNALYVVINHEIDDFSELEIEDIEDFKYLRDTKNKLIKAWTYLSEFAAMANLGE